MHRETREVIVTFAGGRGGPWEKEYQPTSPLSDVRSDAMAHFGVADSAEGGNQVIFRLFHGGERLDDLDGTVGAIGEGHGALALRLVREVIAG